MIFHGDQDKKTALLHLGERQNCILDLLASFPLNKFQSLLSSTRVLHQVALGPGEEEASTND